jgi:DnaJ family protein C protein 7
MRPICRFFNSARGCRNGDTCNFRHAEVKEGDPKRLFSGGGLGDAAPCRYFAADSWCPYGERCWYSHKSLKQPKVNQTRKTAGQALVAAQEVPTPEQQQADKVKEEGNALYRAGKFEEAISHYTSAIGSSLPGAEHYPHTFCSGIYDAEPTYYTNRAAAYISQKQFPLALADCEKARTLQASKPDVKTLLRYARCQLALGATTSALGTLQMARKAQPGIGKVADYKSLKEKADKMQRLSREVGDARRDKRWKSGLHLIMYLLGMLECRYEDTTPHILVWDVEFQIATRLFQQALDTLNTLVGREEKNVEYLELKARAQFFLNRPAEAVATLKKALQIKKDDCNLLTLLLRVQSCETSKEDGNRAFRKDDWTIAAGKYTAALQSVGSSSADGDGGIMRAILLSNRAAAYAKMGAGKLAAALDDLEESVRLHPQNWKAFRSLGRLWVMKGQWKNAARDFKSAIEILSDMMGANAAARRELEEELQKAKIELKCGSKRSHYGEQFCLFYDKVAELSLRSSQCVSNAILR